MKLLDYKKYNLYQKKNSQFIEYLLNKCKLKQSVTLFKYKQLLYINHIKLL